MDEKHEFTISWKACIRIGVTVLAVAFVAYCWGALEKFLELLLGGMLAIIAGLVIAYIVNIPLRFFEGKLPGPTGDGTRNRMLAMLLSYACAVIVVLFLLVAVIPNLIGAIIKLAEAAPSVMDSIEQNAFLASAIPPGIIEQIKSIDWEKVVMDAASWLQSGLSDSLPQILSVFGRIGACFMGIILSFWFLGEKNRLSAGVHKLVKTYLGKWADEKFSDAIAVADKCFRGYFTGAALEGCIFGTIVAIACTIAGMPDAVIFRPVLVYDGHACAITGNGGGLNPRTIIGQRADGAVLLLVIDGRQTSSIGASYEDCINIMLEHNAIVAANLDGGSSSVMYYNGEIINNVVSMNGERLVPTAWVVK